MFDERILGGVFSRREDRCEKTHKNEFDFLYLNKNVALRCLELSNTSKSTGISGFSTIFDCLVLEGVRQCVRAFLIPTHRETFISGDGRGPW